MKFPPLDKAPRGICRAGQYSIRYFSRSYDSCGGGDLWDFAEFADGSLVLFVGDISGHGAAAAEFVPHVLTMFRACVERQGEKCDLARLLEALDCEAMNEFLCRGFFVQATLAYFPPRNSDPMQFVPDTARITDYTSGSINRWLGMTACLLGLGYSAHGIVVPPVAWPFPCSSELLLGTDGLYEQPTKTGDQLRNALARELAHFHAGMPLFGQVVKVWDQAVKEAGGQCDDVVVCSVRHTTDEEKLVFNVWEGVAGSQQEFYEKYRRLVAKLVRKSLSDSSGAAGQSRFPAAGERLATSAEPDSFEDLFQKAFFHLFRNLHKWFGGVVYSWVQQVTTNFLIDEWHRQRKRGDTQLIGDFEFTDPSLAKIRELERRQWLIERLQIFLERQEAKDRRLLELRAAGESVERIIKELGIGRRTYFLRLERLRKEFRRFLNDDDYDHK